MKITSEAIRIHGDVWSVGILIPNDIAEKFINGGDKRVIAEVGSLKPFHCALMSTGDGHWFILLNKERRKELGVAEGERISLSLKKDKSKYGMEMPRELEEVLVQDEWGDRLFHELTPGKMRNIIHYVSQVRSSDIRIRRALVIIEHLKKNQGEIDYKALAEEMKAANQEAKRFRT